MRSTRVLTLLTANLHAHAVAVKSDFLCCVAFLPSSLLFRVEIVLTITNATSPVKKERTTAICKLQHRVIYNILYNGNREGKIENSPSKILIYLCNKEPQWCSWSIRITLKTSLFKTLLPLYGLMAAILATVCYRLLI